MGRLKVVIMGAGGRGCGYGRFCAEHPDLYEVVAVAEPIDARRNYIKELHNLPDEMCFLDWKDLAAQGKIADLCFICMQDAMHYEPALACIELGYHLLLEKPMAPTPKECREITEAAEAKGVKVLVCHVLRYTDFYQKVKDLIAEGKVGEVMSVEHREGVGNEHQSHSFVRGMWRNTAESAPMILAKSCHDMDLLQWLMDKKCVKTQSFGRLSHFCKANAPEGAPARCLDGCPHEDTCFYSVKKLYLGENATFWFRRAATENPNPTDELVIEALKTGKYGRCAYQCDNDVVDHQTVNMEFDDGSTCVFSMNAFNKGGRVTHIMGTKGELHCDVGTNTIEYYDFATRETTVLSKSDIARTVDMGDGHGGGDAGIMFALYDYINDTYKGNAICELRTSYENHLMCFAAEASRLTGKVVDIEGFEE